eukprot:m.45364 g.45364  ORF g.45364 m.45364 type:complete len:482 (+) comp8628_c0_seq1:111-1556(+)
MANSKLARMGTQAFTQYLSSAGITRFYLIPNHRTGGIIASHPELQELADYFAASSNYDNHEGVFGAVGPQTGVLQAAAVHRTCRGQGAGGLRWMEYDSVSSFFTDALRLSRGMTHKNALAGLWWGGGKGVMAKGTGTPDNRELVFQEYGSFVTSLNGAYITAEDVGVTPEDLGTLHTATRFSVSVPEAVGGSGNPSVPTARGVLCGIEAGIEHLGMGDLNGKSVAVQGLGHVGLPLAKMLADKGVSKIVACDVSATNLANAEAALNGVKLELHQVEPGDNSILSAAVDVVSPNATGGILNAETIPTIQAPFVCGATNNQLKDDQVDDRRLADRGILYAPDFLVNRMGIVNCADEAAGSLLDDPFVTRHLGTEWDGAIGPLLKRVFTEADKSDRTPAAVALDLAERMSVEHHPIFGHRGKAIIDSLVASGWATSAFPAEKRAKRGRRGGKRCKLTPPHGPYEVNSSVDYFRRELDVEWYHWP